MKLVRFRDTAGQVRSGRLEPDGGGAVPVAGSFLESPIRFAEQPVRIARLLAPLVPSNIFAIGRNYRAHAEETGSRIPDAPLIFMKATSALNDPDGPIRRPLPAPTEVDFEGELALVIGRETRRVNEATAMDHILGFTCANDVSARDCQRNDKQWTRAKSFDTFCPLGPWIVTRDELDPDRCDIQTRVNDQVMQRSNTSQMTHSCRALVSYLSHQFTLLPGTVILTGTPEGVGMARKPPVFLKPGDRIEVEITGIGVLQNTVVE